MSIVTLMNPDDPAFVFENDQAHRTAAMPNHALDPGRMEDGGYRQDHQTAHVAMQPPTAQNFEDLTDPHDPEIRSWWTWTHLVDHQTEQTLPPLSRR